VRVAVAAGFLVGGCGASGRGDRVLSFGGGVFVGVGERCPGAAEVPDEVGGEHAEQHVGADAVFEAVVDRAQVQVDGLDRAEVAFDVGELFVGGDRGGGVEALGGHAGADDVDAVQRGLGGDLLDAAGDGQGGVGDLEVEVFGHLVLVDQRAGLERDPVNPRAGQPMRGEFLLGCLEDAQPHALGVALPFQNSLCLGQICCSMGVPGIGFSMHQAV